MEYVAIALLAASLTALAQSSPQYRACSEKAKTQTEMNRCASDEAARVDAELNNLYRKLLSKARQKEGAVSRIKAAERAWIGYRDAYISAMYPATDKHAEYGSLYPMEVDLLRARLTQRQVDALNEMLRKYTAREQEAANETLR